MDKITAIGMQARQQAMLDKIVAEKWFTPKAVVGFWPAGAVGDRLLGKI